jgi:dTDP-4-amino-4,6-dideoxygalactose transaminase
LLKAFEYLGYNDGAFPHAEAISREGLSLPMFPEITLEQQQLVATALSQSLGVS